jgi:hypothetical protein
MLTVPSSHIRRRVVGVGIVVTLGALSAILASIFSAGSAHSAPAASFAVLRKPAAPLPAHTFTPLLRSVGAKPARDAHVAFNNGVTRLYAVAPSGDHLCLSVVRATAAVNSCVARSAVTPNDVVWIAHAKPGGVYDLYGLAPDGISSIRAGQRATHVASNAFVLSNVPNSVQDIVITRGSTHVAIHVGQQIPDGVTIAPDPE